MCHKTYSHKCNLRRHINSSHMLKVYKCNICMKDFKRKEYLNRHCRNIHNTTAAFQNIADCIDTESSPVLNNNDRSSTTLASSNVEDMDTFLNSLVYSTASTLDSDTTTIHTSATTSTDVESFLDSLDYSAPTNQDSDITTIPISVTTSVCTQTEVCSLPPVRQPIHVGTSTTPTILKGKVTKCEFSMKDVWTSPHVKMISAKPTIQGWDSPISHSPPTPLLDQGISLLHTKQPDKLRTFLRQ